MTEVADLRTGYVEDDNGSENGVCGRVKLVDADAQSKGELVHVGSFTFVNLMHFKVVEGLLQSFVEVFGVLLSSLRASVLMARVGKFGVGKVNREEAHRAVLKDVDRFDDVDEVESAVPVLGLLSVDHLDGLASA